MTNKYILNNRLTQQYINNAYIDIKTTQEEIQIKLSDVKVLEHKVKGYNNLIIKYINNLDTMET